MKTRKAARIKTGSTQRTAKAVAPKRKIAKKVAKPAAGRVAAGRVAVAEPVALPAECLIASAAELRTTLLSRLSDAANVRIDASAVQRIDTASLQVLAAFARDRRADGLAIEWLEVPACLTDAAALLDLTTALGFEVRA
jgi:ABC-type transporter Mla MlaB component